MARLPEELVGVVDDAANLFVETLKQCSIRTPVLSAEKAMKYYFIDKLLSKDFPEYKYLSGLYKKYVTKKREVQ